MIDAATAHLQSLGFDPTVTPMKKGILVKARTTKGWVYEKFSGEDIIAQIDAWASKHEAAV
jgi:hypothetical protein